MTPDELQARTKQFALRIIRLCDALPKTTAGREMARQLLRSGTSVSANYRAARRARTKKEFIAKIGIVIEEVDETEHWIDLIVDANLIERKKAGDLLDEAGQLTRIFAATRRTARNANRQITRSPDHK